MMTTLSKQKTLHISIFLLLVFTFLGITGAHAQSIDTLNIKGESAILIDGNSGKILYQKNIDEPLPIASMTKMMTEYLILEAVKKGQITWNQKTMISDYVFRISQNRGLSNVPLRKDEQYTVRELFEAAAIYSANGAAIALAEMVSGTEAEFVTQMNNKAKELGLKDYKFVNSTGLNNEDLLGQHPQPERYSADEENVVSTRSTAILAYRLLQDFPEVLKTSRIPKKVFREGTDDAIKMDNWNWMLPSLVFAYEGIDGLKTGSTTKAGYSFTGTAKRNDMRLITVVMKTNSYEARFAETKRLMDYGFSNFIRKQILPKDFQIPNKSRIPVTKGKQKSVEVAGKKPLVITIKRAEEKLYEPVYILDKSKTQDGSLVAPLKKGQRIGALGVNYKGESKYEFVTDKGILKEQVDLITKEEVKKAGFIRLFFRSISSFISESVSNLIKKF